MTTHDQDKIIAAAEEAGIYRLYDGISYGPSGLSSEQFEHFYAIAFEDGRQKEKNKYDELIYAVQTKHPNESRHETALRYIRNAELGDGNSELSAQEEIRNEI